MPVAEGLRDAARERDVAAAVNELAAGSGRGADPDLLRVVKKIHKINKSLQR